MNQIEDQLRSTLQQQVSLPPAVHDPAGSAIAAGEATRRRRRTAAVVATAVAVVALVVGVGVVRAGQFAAPTPPATPPAPERVTDPPPVDVVSGAALFTTEGRKLKLAAGGEVYGIVRVPAGFVYATVGKLWLLDPEGRSTSIVGDSFAKGGQGMAPEFAVSPDGERIAWVDSGKGRLSVAPITDDGFGEVTSTPVPGQTAAAMWLGDKVVLREGCCGGDGQQWRYDLWDPAAGDFRADWSAPVSGGPIAALGDGSTVLGVKSVAEKLCLAEYDPAQRFRELRSSCEFAPSGLAGGRWLATQSADTLEFVDVTTAFNAQPRRLGKCSGIDPEVDAVTVVSDTSVVAQVEGGLVRCSVVDGERVEQQPLDLSSLPKGDHAVVPVAH
ncbi:MAG: hypothetical protein ACRDT4_20510 [Micromonosporaceae bacterium]